MEELYRGTYVEVVNYIENEVNRLCEYHDTDSARKLDNIKWELFDIREQEYITNNTEIALYQNDIVGYHYEIVEEEKTIYDIVKDTQKEFETILSFGAMYGSDTQAPRMLTDIEKEILKNYMSVYTSKLIKNIEKFNNEEE